MAVYTVLPRPLIETMAAVFPDVGAVVDVEGIPQGSINTTYKVTTAPRQPEQGGEKRALWFLRVNEGKGFDALVHERDVLQALSAVDFGGGIVTPTMALSVPGGSFFPIDLDDGSGRRWASWFPGLPGRDLGVFEVTPTHSRQIGAFMGRAHNALAGFSRRRRNPYGLPIVRGWLAVLQQQGVLPAVIERLTRTLTDISRRRRLLPAGLIHGDLFIDNTKWEDAHLRAVFDWEMAGRDHLVLDVCVAVCAWSFVREGERMKLRADVAAALVDGYASERALQPSEVRGFFNELRFAAVRFTASRIRDFEAPGKQGGERRYLDHRDFLQRLDVIEGHGDRGMRALLGVR